MCCLLQETFNSERSNRSLRTAPVIHFTTSEGALSEFLVQGAFVFLQKTDQKESTTEEEHPLVQATSSKEEILHVYGSKN